MPFRVGLIQHGEKRREPDDPGLTRAGRAQAAAVAELLQHARIAAIYASPLRRAHETAQVIATSCGLPVVTESALSERMNWTAASGLTRDEFLSEWGKATANRSYEPSLGESSHAAAARMLRWLSALPNQDNQFVIAVTHGGVTVDLLRTLLGDAELDTRAPGLAEHGVPCGAITEVVIGDDGMVAVERIASTDHLETLSDDRLG